MTTTIPLQLRCQQHTADSHDLLLHLKRFVSLAQQSETSSDPKASLADSKRPEVQALRRSHVRGCHTEDEGDREGSVLGGDSSFVSNATHHTVLVFLIVIGIDHHHSDRQLFQSTFGRSIACETIRPPTLYRPTYRRSLSRVTAGVCLLTSLLEPSDPLKVELAGPSSGNRALGSVELFIAQSDGKANAELALKNLVEETTRRGQSSADDVATKVDELAEAGQRAIQSSLSESFQSAVPRIDNVIQLLDNVAEVRALNIFQRLLLTTLYRPTRT